MPYDPKLREEEIKNKVAVDVFGAFDCTRIFGAVDFCVSVKTAGPTLWETESLLWAEAKAGIRPDLAPLFAQLVLTVGKERTHEKHSPPPFLGAFDSEKIAFLPFHAVIDLFSANDFDWTVAPSDPSTREFRLLLDRVRPLLASGAFVFRFDEAEELAAFVRKNFVVGREGTARLPVTRNNFVFVYNRWREDVMPSIAVDWDAAKKRGILDADFFLADLLSKDGATLVEKLFVVLRGNHYELDRTLDDMGLFVSKRAEFTDGQAAHALFWNRYKRPPKREYWHWIAERRDLLVPQDVRERKGSYFTPQIWVEKAQQALADVLGDDWQDRYDVWDCAAGTGNLLAGLSDKYRVWASTLDQSDVDVMHERIKNGAALLDSHVFRFDFLNDSFDDLPDGLRAIVRDPERRKRLVVFINPPYAEATTAKTVTGTGANKAGVATENKIHAQYKPLVSSAANELFALFLIRIARELSGCVLGQFSKLKHIQASNFKAFRQVFGSRLEKAFVVPAKTFDNVKGEFPIGFFVWRTGVSEPVMDTNADVFGARGESLGKKNLSPATDKSINRWIKQFDSESSGIVGFMGNPAPDFQHDSQLYISGKPGIEHFNFFKINEQNLTPACIYLAVRHCIEADWLNDRDQFLWPAETWKDDAEFQLDCLTFTLFHGQNRISCRAASGSAGGSGSAGILSAVSRARSPRSQVNHWIPFAESEVDAKDAYRSHFMVEFLRGLSGSAGILPAGSPPCAASRAGSPRSDISLPGQGLLFAAEPPAAYGATGGDASSRLSFSPAARAVFDAGRELWRYYHAQPRALPDASYYDIRAHFQGFKPSGHMNADSPDGTYTRLVGALRAAERALAAKIAPKVHEHGFLQGGVALTASAPCPDTTPPPLLAAEN